MKRQSGFRGVGRRVRVTLMVLGVVLLAGEPQAAAQDVDFTSDPTFRAFRSAIFDGLANQVGNIPNPTGGGFTFQFDPALGVFTRTTESFGPVFSDRAETTGRGKITLNASYTRHTWDAVDGVKLGSGALTVVAIGGTRFNLLEFREKIEADVFTIGGLYGVTDRLDVGVTIPILRVSVQERPRRTRFLDCSPDFSVCGPIIQRDDPLIAQKAETTAIGDIVLRGKYNVGRWDLWGGQVGFSTSLDVKLPTGDDGDRDAFVKPDLRFDPPTSGLVVDSFLALPDPPTGTGIFRFKPQLIVSGSWGSFSPHINVGAELGETDGVTNDLVYAVGFDWTIAGRATFVADLLGRHAFGVERPKIDRDLGVSGKADADQYTASIGLKVNPIGTLLVFVNVLIALNDTGLRDAVTPTFGLEWSF